MAILGGGHAAGGSAPAAIHEKSGKGHGRAAKPSDAAGPTANERDALVRDKMLYVFGIDEHDLGVWLASELGEIDTAFNLDIFLLELASIGAKYVGLESSSDLSRLLILRMVLHPNRDLVAATCWYSLLSDADSAKRVDVANTLLLRMHTVKPEDVLDVIRSFNIDGGPRVQRWDESDCERDMLELVGFALAVYGHQVRLPEAQAELAAFLQDIARRRGGRPCEDFLTSARVLAKTMHRVLPD